VKLPRAFYRRKTEVVAKDLLGRVLVHIDGDVRRSGTIVETEAYVGAHDLACHAAKGRTARTDVMFGDAGHAYVYLIYGMYDCFNVVTEPEGYAAAVLVRGVAPIEGCEGATDGPGKLCRAMSLTRAHNRLDLVGDRLFIEEGTKPPRRRIASSARIGVEYAGEWANKPLRFFIDGDPFVSRARVRSK